MTLAGQSFESPAEPQAGISRDLARARAARISGLRYDVSLSIPEDLQSSIGGRMLIAFALNDAADPLTLDFDPSSASSLRTVVINDHPVNARQVNGHIILPAESVRAGDNLVSLTFEAGDGPLNRTADFLYSICVPARAHEALPCFDQPDLKGRWTVTLDVPHAWEALTNGAEMSRQSRNGRARFVFAETAPISTYLFAFAAGRLSVERRERTGRAFRVLHRESGEEAARNLDAIIDLHTASLDWLEQYTGIQYPFGKLDVLLVPAFQFGGMEHPGCLFYNATSLLLDEAATENQQLDRAALIAHETAHLWFGDLVTMPWFDDVWVKEVFANMMAGKILAPLFPGVNHRLRFLHAHYPAAYEIDRTDGTNAIRQPLANLKEAGGLYGAIVYHKSPIVMQQLERMLGPERFRDGLREYLRRHAFSHATWQDLVSILDSFAPGRPGRLDEWSRAWVDDAGRPVIDTRIEAKDDRIERLALVDSTRRDGRAWNQELDVALVYNDRVQFVSVSLDREVADAEAARGLPAPAAVVPNGGGIGYAAFRLDRGSLDWLLQDLPAVADPLVRGAAWLTLWDAMLERDAAPGRLVDLAVRALPREPDELNVQRILVYLQQAYWRFTPARRRLAVAARVERALIDLLHESPGVTMKAAGFRTLRDVALSPTTLAWLTSVWRKEQAVPGLPLAERDDITLVEALAVRALSGGDALIASQLARTANAGRRERLAYVAPALSADPAVRDAFFSSLRDASNRRHEPWVLEGLQCLHHPLRDDQSVGYIRDSLELLPEIQRTGDIFFPKRWTDATLSGHQSVAAAREVRSFLNDLPSGYPDRLRRMVVASADPLFRAVKILGGFEDGRV